MRTKIVEYSGKVSYSFNEEQTPAEVVEKKLQDKFERIGYAGGKVIRIFDVKCGETSEMFLYRNTADTTFELSTGFVAKLEIAYFKPGDILFKGSLLDDDAGIQSIRTIAGIDSMLKVILKINTEEMVPHLKQANLIVVDYVMEKIPMYATNIAIYPMYSPITAGLERKETPDIEPPFYKEIEEPKIDKKYKIYIDPLYEMTPRLRMAKIVGNLRSFLNIQEEPIVSGIEDMMKNKDIKPFKDFKADKNYITFAKISEFEKHIHYMKTHRLYVVYDPSFPLFESDPYVGIVYFKGAVPEAYNETSLRVFKIKVMDYVHMKRHEMLTVDSVVKPLAKLYDEKRKAIIAS